MVKPFGAEVEGITEWFVNGLERVPASHEYLTIVSVYNTQQLADEYTHALKGRRASSRVRSAKDGFAGHGESWLEEN